MFLKGMQVWSSLIYIPAPQASVEGHLTLTQLGLRCGSHKTSVGAGRLQAEGTQSQIHKAFYA